jgi:hypothetical protein
MLLPASTFGRYLPYIIGVAKGLILAVEPSVVVVSDDEQAFSSGFPCFGLVSFVDVFIYVLYDVLCPYHACISIQSDTVYQICILGKAGNVSVYRRAKFRHGYQYWNVRDAAHVRSSCVTPPNHPHSHYHFCRRPSQ